jgi:hypothetical protein
MNAIGMYMTGNSLQIFSIFMVFTLFKNPLTAIMNIGNTFGKLETEGTRDQMLQVKIVFVLCNLLAVGLGVWKVDKMGLLPYVVSLTSDGGGELLTCEIGRRGRIGLLGRRRGSHSREHSQLGRHRVRYRLYDRTETLSGAANDENNSHLMARDHRSSWHPLPCPYSYLIAEPSKLLAVYYISSHSRTRLLFDFLPPNTINLGLFYTKYREYQIRACLPLKPRGLRHAAAY